MSCPNQMELNIYGECVCSKGLAIMNGRCMKCDEGLGGYILSNRCYYCPGDLKFNGEKCGCGRNQI